MIEKALATPLRGDRPATIADDTARAALPARYALERADWAAAAALPVTSSRYPQADSLTRFSRGLGKARIGDLAGARQEIAALETLQRALATSADRYWADRTQEQILTVSAWVALAERATDKAVALMRKAADGEDGSLKHVAMENRLYPLRELLAYLLLERGDARAALAEFETSSRQTPNRFRGLYGAATAADAAGDRARAVESFEKLLALAKSDDGTRPELKRAREYLAKYR